LPYSLFRVVIALFLVILCTSSVLTYIPYYQAFVYIKVDRQNKDGNETKK